MDPRAGFDGAALKGGICRDNQETAGCPIMEHHLNREAWPVVSSVAVLPFAENRATFVRWSAVTGSAGTRIRVRPKTRRASTGDTAIMAISGRSRRLKEWRGILDRLKCAIFMSRVFITTSMRPDIVSETRAVGRMMARRKASVVHPLPR